MQVRLLTADQIAGLVTPDVAAATTREAYRALARGEAVLPAVMTFDLVERRGEVHGKGGYLPTSPYFTVKVAAGFAGNPALGLAANSGVVLAFDAHTGYLAAMLVDGGLLTDLRTAAAAAVAADLLARPDASTAAILGTGNLARHHLDALVSVRRLQRLTIWNRTRDSAESFAAAARARCDFVIEVATSADEAVRGADIVITSTAARRPIVSAGAVRPGTHVSAVGADMPDKNELPPDLLAKSAVYVDRLDQCLTQGDLHHAVEAGLLRADQVRGEIGELLEGRVAGRGSSEEVTIADLTGVGVLDTALAAEVTRRAIEAEVGRVIEV